MRIFLLLLLVISYCFALAPKGVTHYQTITINSAQVDETNSHFLYQVKLPRIAAACTSAVNVVVYKSTTDTTKSPKWAVYTTDTIYLYADVAVSTSAGGSLVVGYGLNVIAVNSSSTFTNCGIDQAWLFDEADGSATVSNVANGSVGTVYTPAFISNRKAVFTADATGPATNCIMTNESTLMTASRTIVTVGKSAAVAGTHSYINNRYYGTGGGGFVLYTNPTNVVAAVSPATSVAYSTNTGNRMQIAASISNDNILKLYTDGVYRAAGNVSTGIYTTPATSIIGGNNAGGTGYVGFNGEIEQIIVFNSELSSENISSQYNMLFTPAAFSTVSSVASTEQVIPTDTLTFTCSATGATSYQWYIADTAVTGETDSVITILADSAFYASKPTVYCLVNGSVISDSWVIRETSTTGSRRSGYRQINMGQGMH